MISALLHGNKFRRAACREAHRDESVDPLTRSLAAMDDFDPTVTNSPKFRLIAVQCVSPPSASPTPRPVRLRREPSEEKEAPFSIVGWLPPRCSLYASSTLQSTARRDLFMHRCIYHASRRARNRPDISLRALLSPTKRNTVSLIRPSTPQLFSITAFAAMLSQRHGLAGPDEMTLEECGPQACGYQKFSNFKFLIAVCIVYARLFSRRDGWHTCSRGFPRR